MAEGCFASPSVIVKKVLLALFLFIFPWGVDATEAIPPELKDVGITERLGESINLEVPFRDENSRDVLLKDYFKADEKLPTVLLLVYFECPNLCTFVLNEFLALLNQVAFEPGKHFQVLVVSIDPSEGPALARQKKEAYLTEYKKHGPGDKDWHFLTGTEESIKRISSDVGFSYRYDEEQKQFAHAAAFFVLTPAGKISRYIYGINYKPLDFRLAITEAGEGKIGTLMDRLLLFCYHYDPKGNRYALLATRLMKLGGVVTIVFIAGLVYGLSRRKQGSLRGRNA